MRPFTLYLGSLNGQAPARRLRPSWVPFGFITTVRAKLDLSVALNGWLQTQKSIHSTLSKQTLTEKPILIKQ